MKKIVFIIFMFSFQFVFSQLKEATFQTIEMDKNKKPTVVFIYTNWCKYCHAMQATSFKNEEVVKLLNNKFNFIKFNAEQRGDIEFFERKFAFKSNGKKSGVHSLAEALGTIDGKLEFPTTVVLNSEYEIIFQYAAMLQTNELLTTLKTISKNEKI